MGRLGDWETLASIFTIHHSPSTIKLGELSGIIDRYVVAIFEVNGVPFTGKNLFLCVRHKQWKVLELVLGSLNYLLD